MSNYNVIFSNELYHHGIKGQKWGVRRFQNEDGTLTEKGLKRLRSNKEFGIAAGTTLYRISSNKTSDAKDDNLYVNATKEAGEFYKAGMAKGKLEKSGKAFVQEYVVKTDIVLPSKKVMEKVELGLLEDKEVKKELVDSLVRKGKDREKAEKELLNYSKGKAIWNGIGGAFAGLGIGALSGGLLGLQEGKDAGLVGAVSGGLVGATAGAVAGYQGKKHKTLDNMRITYGDKENVKTQAKLRSELGKQGYNGMKDYNDRRAYDNYGKDAVIVFGGKDKVKMTKSKELSKDDYASAYAKIEMEQNPGILYNEDVLKKRGAEIYDKAKATYKAGKKKK